MDPETYAAAINRAAEALHTELQTGNPDAMPLADLSIGYQEAIYRNATVMVDALSDLLPQADTVTVALPQPSHIVSEELAYFEPDRDLPAVRVEEGVVRYGSQSYWNTTKGDSPLALAAALLAADRYARKAAA